VSLIRARCHPKNAKAYQHRRAKALAAEACEVSMQAARNPISGFDENASRLWQQADLTPRIAAMPKASIFTLGLVRAPA
jgi:hypothetical protein